MGKARVKETEVAAAAVRLLESYGWDVYQEVRVHHGGPVADIVGRLGNLIWVVEAKASFTLTVLEQAWHWRRSANLVSVITPRPKGDATMRVAIMKSLGIGHFVYQSREARVDVSPRLSRKVGGSLLAALRPEHKTATPAGTSGGGYWTPFSETCKLLREYVAANPGCQLKQAIDAISHHYASDASARASLLKWLEMGRMKGVLMRYDGGKILLYPAPYVGVSPLVRQSGLRRRRRG